MDWLQKIVNEVRPPKAEGQENQDAPLEAPAQKNPFARFINPIEQAKSFIHGIRKPETTKPPAIAGGGQGPDDVFNRLIQAESRGKHRDASGKLTTSPVGALGITQVMPKSGRDPGFGVAPLKDDSEGEYLRFGKELLTAYTANFGGDIAKGLAAYNYGPGALQKVIDKHGDSWRDKLPAETKKYLTKILGKTNGG